MSCVEFRSLSSKLIGEFTTEWLSRQPRDPEGYPPAMSVSEWWIDFIEWIQANAVEQGAEPIPTFDSVWLLREVDQGSQRQDPSGPAGTVASSDAQSVG